MCMKFKFKYIFLHFDLHDRSGGGIFLLLLHLSKTAQRIWTGNSRGQSSLQPQRPAPCRSWHIQVLDPSLYNDHHLCSTFLQPGPKVWRSPGFTSSFTAMCLPAIRSSIKHERSESIDTRTDVSFYQKSFKNNQAMGFKSYSQKKKKKKAQLYSRANMSSSTLVKTMYSSLCSLYK